MRADVRSAEYINGLDVNKIEFFCYSYEVIADLTCTFLEDFTTERLHFVAEANSTHHSIRNRHLVFGHRLDEKHLVTLGDRSKQATQTGFGEVKYILIQRFQISTDKIDLCDCIQVDITIPKEIHGPPSKKKYVRSRVGLKMGNGLVIHSYTISDSNEWVGYILQRCTSG